MFSKTTACEQTHGAWEEGPSSAVLGSWGPSASASPLKAWGLRSERGGGAKMPPRGQGWGLSTGATCTEFSGVFGEKEPNRFSWL